MPARATSIEDLQRRMADFRSPEAANRGLGIAVRPTDVFISTYPKCGTTWSQQIVHQLRSGGSMDFDEICVVVPWLESAWDMGIDPDADQAWEPRAFKAHLDWERIPKGGRYLSVFRDPSTAAASFYRFFSGYLMEPGAIGYGEFVREWLVGGSASGRMWEFYVSWWKRRRDPAVLLLAYEDMVADPERAVRAIARHIGVESETAIEVAIANSSREFMTAHAGQFDDHAFRAATDHRVGLPPGGTSAKVQPTPTSAVADPELVDLFDRLWATEVDAATGLASYEELRAALAAGLDGRGARQ